jgi:hypothetical protein
MGHVKECYLQYEKAGNQYLGQVVCELDVNSVKFAILPPFFEFDCTRQGDTGQGDTGQGDTGQGGGRQWNISKSLFLLEGLHGLWQICSRECASYFLLLLCIVMFSL